MPVHSTLDSLLKKKVLNQPIQSIIPQAKKGQIIDTGKTVLSHDIFNGQNGISLHIKGNYDARVAYDDGTYGLIDFKLSKLTEDNKTKKLEQYTPQLYAYAYALEYPASGNPLHVSELWLYFLYPESLAEDYHIRISSWSEKLEYDVTLLQNFKSGLLQEVYQLLAQAQPPDSAENCDYCNYLKSMQPYFS